VVNGSETGVDYDTLVVSGVDYIDYDDANPENGIVYFEGGGSLTFTNIENVDVSDRDGTVSGTAGDDVINSTYVDPNDGDQVDDTDAIIPGHDANDDLIEAGGGDDQIDAGLGSDTVYAGTGNETIFSGADGSADTVFGEAGEDTMFGFASTARKATTNCTAASAMTRSLRGLTTAMTPCLAGMVTTRCLRVKEPIPYMVEPAMIRSSALVATTHSFWKKILATTRSQVVKQTRQTATRWMHRTSPQI